MNVSSLLIRSSFRLCRLGERKELQTIAISPGPHACHLCPRILPTYNALRGHIKRMHTVGVQPHICHVCGKALKSAGALSRHIQTLHEGRRDFKCDLCPKAFTAKDVLNNHRKSHFDERPFVCEQCGRGFKNVALLRMHTKYTHTKDFTTYPCTTCQKEFRTKSSLSYHMMIHTGDVRFTCHVCNKGFIFEHALKRHSAVHSDAKPFRCVICDASFVLERYLMRHLISRHPSVPVVKRPRDGNP